MVCGVDKINGQNHAEIDTIPYRQKCRKSAVSGRFFYFRHCGGIGRTAVLPGGFALFKGEEAEKNIHPVTGALFTQEMLQSEFDYYMAQKLLEKLREAGLITKEELDKITAKNRQSFSPYLARIMP